MKRGKCGEYKRFELMKLKPEDFWKHAEKCAECRQKAAQDEKIMAAARELRQGGTIEAAGLWERIEKDLTRLRPSRASGRSLILKPALLVPLTAGLLLALGIGLYIALKPNRPGKAPGLLAQEALVKVEKAEAEYLRAIRDLEKMTLSRMSSLDLELRFLYKDRLTVIDAQIERCREALDANPANAHIRRYMMAALQDKKETLAELLKAENRPAEKIRLNKTT